MRRKNSAGVDEVKGQACALCTSVCTSNLIRGRKVTRGEERKKRNIGHYILPATPKDRARNSLRPIPQIFHQIEIFHPIFKRNYI
jgi:hypothetical protein